MVGILKSVKILYYFQLFTLILLSKFFNWNTILTFKTTPWFSFLSLENNRHIILKINTNRNPRNHEFRHDINRRKPRRESFSEPRGSQSQHELLVLWLAVMEFNSITKCFEFFIGRVFSRQPKQNIASGYERNENNNMEIAPRSRSTVI